MARFDSMPARPQTRLGLFAAFILGWALAAGWSQPARSDVADEANRAIRAGDYTEAFRLLGEAANQGDA